MDEHKTHKKIPSDYRRFNFSNPFSKNRNLLSIIIIILIVLVIVVLLFFFLRNKNATPGIKMVSGTEYISNEEGQVIIRLENSIGNPIDDANCMLSLLYPDKSFFLIDIQMTPTTVPGNYYHSFVTPEKEGIYEEHIVCSVPVGNDNFRELYISSSFHVSTGLNLIVEVSRSQREQYEDLVNRVNALDSNLTAKINSVDSRVYNVQTFIDNNVMDEIDNLSVDIGDINQSISSSMDGIEGRLNTTMLNNFDELYQKFRDSYNAMAGVFGGGE